MNKLKQYATMAGLSNGNFDGQFKLHEIISENNFGLGTFEAVDGELIGFDNKFYRLRGDGTVSDIHKKDLSPFASLMNFENPVLLKLSPNANKDTLLATLLPEVNPNRVYALKITGKFSFIKTRALLKQSKPYVTLLEASKTQSVLEKENLEGTIVGFLSPKLFNTIMVEGLHLHFINDEKSFGGHVLDFRSQEVQLEIVEIDQLDLIFDQSKKPIEVKQTDIEQAES